MKNCENGEFRDKSRNKDFAEQIQEIFGTTDIEKLRNISNQAREYDRWQVVHSAKKHPSGRKNSFTQPQIAEMLALHDQGEKIASIARKYQVSRQTIYTQMKRAHRFSDDPDVKMRMNYMNHNDLCTTIDIDFRHERIKIENYTNKIPLRAFGVVEEPSWADFEYFLEDRCFPKTRDHAKEILREIGVPFYDPLLIIEKTKGYMEGDYQWILILKREDD